MPEERRRPNFLQVQLGRSVSDAPTAELLAELRRRLSWEAPKEERAKWPKWALVPEALLWQGVALSYGIEPNVGVFLDSFSKREAFAERLFIAESNLHHGLELAVARARVRGQPRMCTVIRLSVFAAWAVSIGWEVPSEFKGLAVTSSSSASKWPWGDHTTQQLEHLAAAAKQWWSTYDQDNPHTAPTNEEVAQWLIEQRRVVQRTAEAIASMLRPENLPKGRRKGRHSK